MLVEWDSEQSGLCARAEAKVDKLGEDAYACVDGRTGARGPFHVAQLLFVVMGEGGPMPAGVGMGLLGERAPLVDPGG